jgi:hypothetical protein
MARKFKVIGDQWVGFIPEFEKNKSFPESEQISCKIKYISQSDSDKTMDVLLEEKRNGKDLIGWSSAHSRLVSSNVKEIKNLVVETPEGEKEIKAMQDMYNIPELKPLYIEIANAIDNKGKLTELEIKN